ncbi:hypothetical protein VULLAG_LOCUS10089 [Vulpes lagopus]
MSPTPQPALRETSMCRISGVIRHSDRSYGLTPGSSLLSPRSPGPRCCSYPTCASQSNALGSQPGTPRGG